MVTINGKSLNFEDGSEFAFPDIWVEAINLKYGVTLEEYVNNALEYTRKLRENGKVLTKFGEIDIHEEMTMQTHFQKCVYADLRVALIGLVLRELGSDAKVIALQGDGTAKEYPSGEERKVEEMFGDNGKNE